MSSGFVHREFPAELSDLADLSLDLRWTTSLLTRRIWQRLDPEAWARSESPHLILQDASEQRLKAAARDQVLLDELAWWRKKRDDYQAGPTWYSTHHEHSQLRRVAYFSMEFGLSEELAIYSGGLGMLAGDHLKSASDLGVPLVGIGILYQQGYFRQVLAPDGQQSEAYPYNDPGNLPVSPLIQNGEWQRVLLELPGRMLSLRVWQARIGRVPLYLLDSNDPVNSPWDRGITASLYDAGQDKRLLQEIILGVGGWRLLEQLGIDVDVCHLNEGHAAFAVLARAVGLAHRTGVTIPLAFRAARAGNVFTTHTPISAAFDEFDPAMLTHYAMPFLETVALPAKRLLALGRSDPRNSAEPFNMAFLAMRGCCHVNAVSQLHGRVSRRLFSTIFKGWPETEVPIGAITNGVHIPTWNSALARGIWVSHSDDNGWFEDLSHPASALNDVDPTELWNMRVNVRQTLVEYVRTRLQRQLQVQGASESVVRAAGHVLDPNVLTLGFARRFTEYKRPTLLLHDTARFVRLLLDQTRPVQLIVAGKAHPNDSHGKELVRTMAMFAMRPELRNRVVFIEDYDMVLAQHLAGGIDVWLNTPRRPAEACGTSGMKMLFNGGLHLSVRDGWWDEAWTPSVGWAIGDGLEDDAVTRDIREAEQLYEVLEQEVVPEFYDRDADGIPHRWLERVYASMSGLTPQFSSHRMVKDYVRLAYCPAAEAIEQRIQNDAQVARELHEWQQQLEENWRDLRFGELRISNSDDQWKFAVDVYLGDLDPGSVRVELFADSLSDGRPAVIPMCRNHALPGAVNGYAFTANAPNTRHAGQYTPRIVPWHPAAFVPSEQSLIHWQR